MVKLNQKTESQGVIQIKNNMGVGRYDVVMDTGPGYETKRIEAAENFLDLLKTPMGEPVVKVASDVVMRNFDFPGAQDVADRLMPATPEGMKKAMEGLPKQAQSIVQAMQQQLTQAQQTIQQLQLEIKYKMNVEGLKQEGETRRTLMESHTKVHDTDTRAATALQEAHIREQGGLARTEIQAAGQLLNTHAEAAHDRAAAKELLKAGERAEKSNGAK